MNPLWVMSSLFFRYDLRPSICFIYRISVTYFIFWSVNVKMKLDVRTTHRSLHYLRNLERFLRVPERIWFLFICLNLFSDLSLIYNLFIQISVLLLKFIVGLYRFFALRYRYLILSFNFIGFSINLFNFSLFWCFIGFYAFINQYWLPNSADRAS